MLSLIQHFHFHLFSYRVEEKNAIPDVVPFTVGFPISDKTRAGLVQILVTLRALQTGRVPL